MIKTLLKKQILEMFSFLYQSGKKGGRRHTAALIGYVILLVYLGVVMAASFFITADTLCERLLKQNEGWLYFALFGTVATILGVFGSVFFVHSGLYQAKDNEMLLAMPIHPSKILFARMVSLYAMCFVFEAVAMVPAFIVYGMKTEPAMAALGLQAAILCILPLMALTIACVLGWGIGIFNAHVRMRGKKFVTVFLSLLLIGGFYYFFLKVYGYLQILLANSGQIGGAMKTILYPMYQMGLAAQGDAIAFLIFAAMALAVFGAVYLLLSHSFVKILTTRQGAVKARYRETRMKKGSAEGALWGKEGLRFTGSSVYMLNCGLGTVMFFIVTAAVFIKGAFIKELLEQFFHEGSHVLPIYAGLFICAMATMNDLTAPSVSLEGKNLWIVKSMPVSSLQILRAKLKFHLSVTLPPALICAVSVMALLKSGPVVVGIVLCLVALFVLLTAQLGLFFGLKFPNLDWSSETVAVKQGIGVGFSLMSGWLAVILMFGIYAVAGRTLGVGPCLGLITLLLAVSCIILQRWLKTKGTKILDRL